MKIYALGTSVIFDMFFPQTLDSLLMKDYLAALPIVTRFCNETKTHLSRVETTNERGLPEPLYFFDDNLGGYTIRGIKDSLKFP